MAATAGFQMMDGAFADGSLFSNSAIDVMPENTSAIQADETDPTASGGMKKHAACDECRSWLVNSH